LVFLAVTERILSVEFTKGVPTSFATHIIYSAIVSVAVHFSGRDGGLDTQTLRSRFFCRENSFCGGSTLAPKDVATRVHSLGAVFQKCKRLGLEVVKQKPQKKSLTTSQIAFTTAMNSKYRAASLNPAKAFRA